jgi:hypothetical protein
VGVLNEGMILILEISCFSVPPDSAPRRYKSGNTVAVAMEKIRALEFITIARVSVRMTEIFFDSGFFYWDLKLRDKISQN